MEISSMKAAAMAATILLSGCQPPNPVTDAQFAAVAKRCTEIGMAIRVFNGATSFVECVAVDKAKP